MVRLADLASRPDLDVGNLTLSPARRRLFGPFGEAHLEPLIMTVLLILVDARGSVVTRQRLFDEVWGNATVGDDSLNRIIARLRRILSEIAPGAICIETIPRTGYRLECADPNAETGDERTAQTADGKRTLPISRRIVVGAGLSAAIAVTAGGWWNYRDKERQRHDALVKEADRLLRIGFQGERDPTFSLLQEALRIDPRSPAALGLMAYTHARAATDPVDSRGGDHLTQALAVARNALQIKADQPDALLALALIETGGFDWIEVEDRLRRIIATSPLHLGTITWLTALLQATGRLRDSWNMNERSLKIDPVGPDAHWRKALKLWIFGRVSQADIQIDRLRHLWPGHPWVWNARFLIFAFSDRPHAALDMIDDVRTRPKGITPARLAQWRPTLVALETQSARHRDAALQANLVAARQSPGQAAYAIMALSGLALVDAAYDVAQGFLLSRGPIVTRSPTDQPNRLVNSRGWRQTQWLFTPPLAGLRADPRFAGLCADIGLEDYWLKRQVRPDHLDA